MALTVPQPKVTVEGITDYRYVAEKPMTLSCGTASFPDGSQLEPAQTQQFGFRLYRKLSTGVVEVWNEAGKSWGPQSAAAGPEPLAFIDNVWQNVLVAIGQQDGAGQDKFATDLTSGFPKYFVRCVFSATDTAGQQHDGISPPSTEFTVSPAGVQNRAGLAIVPPMEITQANEIRLYLKDAARIAERGVIAIRQSGSGFEIDLTVGNASILLTSTGAIQIEGDVSIKGELRVNDFLMTVP